MEIVGVLEFLCGVLDLEGAEFGAHRLNRNKERALGLFARGRGVGRVGTIGGEANRGYDALRLVILVRWGRDGVRAEAKAREIYEAVAGCGFEHGGKSGFLTAVNEGPVWVGVDERGVFEYTVDFDVYAARN